MTNPEMAAGARILVAIPHYVGPPVPGGTLYGSGMPDAAAARAQALTRTIAGLRIHLGERQGRVGWSGPDLPAGLPTVADRTHVRIERANAPTLPDRLDIVVVIVGRRHALDRVALPASTFEVEETTLDRLGGDPRMLGFACHEVLAARAARYDWACYLEDDTVIADPWFLRKIALVERATEGQGVLLPNRFEADPAGRFQKLYVDGPVPVETTAAWQDIAHQPAIGIRHLGGQAMLERPTNPHAGCFFLTRRQFARWRAEPHFGRREPLFAGALESAATLGIMRTFRLYKPALENADFLEAEHLNNREWLTFKR
ncbi:hypothetical protein STHU_50720 [Allostella humosa]|nr:hypothetical protein [Stella humosa]BBK34438.1 hypothetical protein STHU_50720 [Stella humosa]